MFVFVIRLCYLLVYYLVCSTCLFLIVLRSSDFIHICCVFCVLFVSFYCLVIIVLCVYYWPCVFGCYGLCICLLLFIVWLLVVFDVAVVLLMLLVFGCLFACLCFVLLLCLCGLVRCFVGWWLLVVYCVAFVDCAAAIWWLPGNACSGFLVVCFYFVCLLDSLCCPRFLWFVVVMLTVGLC